MSLPCDKVTFGSQLRKYRRGAGLTQEELASRSGVSIRTIQHTEADSGRPRRSTLALLADALDLSGPVRDSFLRLAAPLLHRPAPTPFEGASGGRNPAPILSMWSLHAPDDDVADEYGGGHLVVSPRRIPNNIPSPVNILLGREADLIAVRKMIAGDHRRMVTLLGVGGAGKTRLAVQAAADLLEEFPDGVWLVELAPATSPALVPRIVAGAIGILENGDVPILQTLLEFLRWKRLLLVLDNCEHLIDACAALAEQLLAACPGLHILATSRQPLHIDGERRWHVRPLAVPDANGQSGPVAYDVLARTASVRLFVARAEAIYPTFRLTEANAASVGRICIRQGGIPLAIQLAASRISVLAVEQIAERLEHGIRVLAGSRRTGPTRQQTMEAALGWSYDLLTPSERAMFRRLGTFAGGFDLEASEAICHVEALGELEILDVLDGLVDKSLVVAEQVTAGTRYRLLEPVRRYAQHLLVGSGKEHDARAGHANYYAALAERAAPKLRGPELIVWLDRLEEERNNLWATLSWIAEQGEIEDGVRVAVHLVPYWEVRGHLSEGRRWLDVALAQGERLSPASRCSARLAAGRLAFWHGDLAAAVAHFEAVAADAAATSPSEDGYDADTLTWLGAALGAQGAFEAAESTLLKALALQEARNDAWGAAWALFNLGRVVGNRTMHGTRQHADMLRTSEVTGESARRFHALGDLRFMAIASMYQGIILVHAGERTRPAHLLLEGLAGLQAVGERAFLFPCVIALSVVAMVLDQPERAARLLGAAEALGQALGTALAPVNRRTHESAVIRIRPLLAGDAFTEARAAGWIMTLPDVLMESHELASNAALAPDPSPSGESSHRLGC